MPKVHEDWKILPHGPLVEIDDGILCVAGDIPMPLGNFPRRMTVVRLSDKRTAIWSAIALGEAEMARIEAMGQPSFLIVPDEAHRLDAKAYLHRYPKIRVLAPPGARDKVQEVVHVDATTDVLADPDVGFHTVAGVQGRDSALTIRRAGGMTLVVNDILGNVQHPHGLGAAIMARLMKFGVHGPEITRPAASFIKDHAALAAQLREFAGLPDLKRIIVSHGDIIDEDPAGTLERLAGELEQAKAA